MYYLPFSPFSPDFDAVSVPCRSARNIQKKTRKETAMDTKSSMPRVESSLRHQILKMPEATYEAGGIVAAFTPKGAQDFMDRKRKKPAPEQSQRPFRSRFSLILQYFGLFQPQKQENCLIYPVDKSGNLFATSQQYRCRDFQSCSPKQNHNPA